MLEVVEMKATTSCRCHLIHPGSEEIVAPIVK